MAKTVNRTLQVLYERASLRSFARRDVEEDVLDKVLLAASLAASGGNLQPFSVIVVRDPAVRTRLGELCDQPFIGKAPANLVFCMDLRRNRRLAEAASAPYTAQRSFRHFWIAIQDVMIAAQSACTAADALGLGTCYIGTILEIIDEASKLLDLPDGVLPVELLTLGYPARKPRLTRKLPPSVLVHRERYRDVEIGELRGMYEESRRHRVFPVSPEQLERFRQSCAATGDAGLAARAAAEIEARGGFNSLQRTFGLHYCADTMPEGNSGFVETIRRRGFDVFR